MRPMNEQTSEHAEDQFDAAVDDATHAVIEAFGEFALPEGDELSNLMVCINDALTPIMRYAITSWGGVA